MLNPWSTWAAWHFTIASQNHSSICTKRRNPPASVHSFRYIKLKKQNHICDAVRMNLYKGGKLKERTCVWFLVVQASLNKLMETLGQSEPYFVKCIRSNAEKVLLTFAWRVCLGTERKEFNIPMFLSFTSSMFLALSFLYALMMH